jgi:hypothetical protein
MVTQRLNVVPAQAGTHAESEQLHTLATSDAQHGFPLSRERRATAN